MDYVPESDCRREDRAGCPPAALIRHEEDSRAAGEEARDAVKRKRIQRIYRALNWVEPLKEKRKMIRSNDKVPKASTPYHMWEIDFTYVWCGVADGDTSSTSSTSS